MYEGPSQGLWKQLPGINKSHYAMAQIRLAGGKIIDVDVYLFCSHENIGHCVTTVVAEQIVAGRSRT